MLHSQHSASRWNPVARPEWHAGFLSRIFFLSIIVAFSNTGWAQQLTNDEFVTAETTRNGQIDRYTFTATAGDTVYLNVADRDNTNFSPRVDVFGPDSEPLESDTSPFTASIFGLAIAQTGQHVVLVRESGTNTTGTYTLHYARAPGANEGGRLENDAEVAGTLELGDIDTFTFEARVGERVNINLADSGNTNMSPIVHLVDPSGTVFERDSSPFVASLRDIEINVAGTWTVVLSERGGDSAGDYGFYFARSSGGNEKGLLPNDARRAAKLALGDIDTWTFSAESGDQVHLKVADIDNTNFSPRFALYAPDGTQAFVDSSPFVAAMSGFQAAADGIYTVVVQSSNSTAADYELHFARAPGANEGGSLVGATARQGTLDLGDIDTFEFGAAANATVDVTVSDTDNTSLSPRVIIYDALGNEVARDSSPFTASVSFRTPFAGFYTAVLEDSSSGSAGNYTLDYSYVGGEQPVRPLAIVLESKSWYLLGLPGESTGTLGNLFAGVLDPAAYGDASSSSGWVIWVFEPDTLDATTGTPGMYRRPDLSEPVPVGTGFWVIHLNESARRLNLPVAATDATGVTGDNCADGGSCITTPLATVPGGGWTIGAVPTRLSPGVDTFRLVTDAAAPVCANGCTLEAANEVDYSKPGGVWTYEQSTGNYRLLSGTDSVAPWTGFWFRTNAAASEASPRLLLPVR